MSRKRERRAKSKKRRAKILEGVEVRQPEVLPGHTPRHPSTRGFKNIFDRGGK